MKWLTDSLANNKLIFGSLLFLIFSLMVMMVVLTGALAFEDPHGVLPIVDTEVCAECHRTHTAFGDYLTAYFRQMDKCLTCHDGTGSSIVVTEAFGSTYHHTIGGIDTDSEKECANCHETHALESTGSALLVNPLNTRILWTVIDSLTAESYDTLTITETSAASALYLWCEQCHKNSTTETIDYMVSERIWGSSYVPYQVNVVWKTPKDPDDPVYPGVDDSGTTTGYWQYFKAEIYNETSATIGDKHGRAESTSTTMEWYGPYYAGYPAMPCTDCHDQHGSNQPWMIVDTITVESVTIANYDMRTASGQLTFCTACHSRGNDPGPVGQKCTDCHRHTDKF
jgi:predicted CXXCH cytochrome family protein